jgi:hypothetical protein
MSRVQTRPGSTSAKRTAGIAGRGKNNGTGKGVEKQKLPMKAPPIPVRSTRCDAPPIVHTVLRSPGRPLDDSMRAYMEPRFGHDFSRVRVHDDARAAGSAETLNAAAYTVGNHVVFGSGRYAPASEEGRRLLAHELAHAVQQEIQPPHPGPIHPIYPSPGGDRAQILQRQVRQRRPRASIPPRGTNPAVCMHAVCNRIAQWPSAKTDAHYRKQTQQWLDASLDCVRNGASASNASHFAAIRDNNVQELTRSRNEILQDYGAMTSRERARARGKSIKKLSDNCRRHQTEARIEFHYNVVFENPAGSPRWGYGPSEWPGVEAALSALPAEAAWANPRLLRFRRRECHPSNVNPQGQCQTTGQKVVAGQTEAGTGEITIFNPGFGQAPFSRSAALGLPATYQSIRHEVGHVVMSQIAVSERNDFFQNIVPWHEFNLNRITHPQAYATWKTDRENACRLLGIDDNKLDAWLASLVPDQPKPRGKWTCCKRPVAPGSTSYNLQCFETARVPKGDEFSYARENPEEYFAELYAFAVSRPGFLHAALPADQTAWLKRVVFRTPETIGELSRMAALNEPAQTEYILRGSRLFTWEQLDALMNELTAKQRFPGSEIA